MLCSSSGSIAEGESGAKNLVPYDQVPIKYIEQYNCIDLTQLMHRLSLVEDKRDLLSQEILDAALARFLHCASAKKASAHTLSLMLNKTLSVVVAQPHLKMEESFIISLSQ